MEAERPPCAPDGGDIDLHNDETFGDGAVEDDWEASHFAVVGGKGNSPPTAEALHRDEAILNAMPTVTTNHTHNRPESELESSVASLSLKDLWPSSPKQDSQLESIWSSPKIPQLQDHAQQATPTMGGAPPGQKVISVEELERELTTSPPPSSPSLPPPHSHPSPLSQHNRSPPPPHMMYPPHGGLPLPVHAFMGRGGWHIRGPPLPPPPHLLPPHMILPHSRQPPTGVSAFRPPLPRHPLLHYPPRYPLPPPPPPQSLRPPRPLHDPSTRSDIVPSRRSELLSEMKPDGSGFMTQREKEWVVKVQLLQLQGSDPDNDDYYYLNYVQRKARRESADLASFSLALPQVSHEEKNYQPVKLEHTLGKLTPSSLATPRKAIDAPVGVGEVGGGAGVTVEVTTRKRQVLLIIERLYSHVLSLEDLERRALSLPEEERGVVLEQKECICTEIFALLRLRTLEKNSSGEEQMFQQMTSYRKGKRLLKRILPVLTDVHAQAILQTLLRNIIVILKRDITDQALPEVIPALKGVISTCDLQLTTRCITTLLALTSGTNTVPSPIVRVASSEFGSSLLLCLVRRGNLLCESPYKTSWLYQDWLTTTVHLHTALSSHTPQLLSLSANHQLLAELLPSSHQ